MASKIEHAAKCHAYSKCNSWNRGIGEAIGGVQSCTFYSSENYKKHVAYLNQMREDGKHYYGTPPSYYGWKYTGFLRNFANYLAHKLLEYAWGRKSLYL